MKFEYKQMKFHAMSVRHSTELDVVKLNVEGANGWELVQVVGGYCLFKRAIEEPIQIETSKKDDGEWLRTLKLKCLNAMKIAYYDTDMVEDEVTYYIITVDDNAYNRSFIKALGYTDEDIYHFLSHRENEIDLTHFAWEHAKWFDGTEFGIQ